MLLNILKFIGEAIVVMAFFVALYYGMHILCALNDSCFNFYHGGI
tara:strand:+ start:781 stop:915 length:135 start_codon:yes stop_codon:yes gene_type:complete